MKVASGLGSLNPTKNKYLRRSRGAGLPNFHMRAVRPGGAWAKGGMIKKPVTSSDKAALDAVRKPCK